VTNQKGGVGKSVLSTNLAVEAVLRKKKKTLLIDLDPQQSSTRWWEAREAEEPLLIHCDSSGLEENINAAKEGGFDLVIIDTPGKESVGQTRAIDLATFCLIPCQPSKDDIRSAVPVVEVVNARHKNFAFVITRCPYTGSDGQEAHETLSSLGLVCKTFMMERKCYKRAYGADMGVMEYDPSDKAATEIADIYKWIENKNRRLKNAA
jgi:chromosome partitioning protein